MFERCVYFNVNALARQINSIWEAAFAEFDLSPAHAYLLRLVIESPGMSNAQIATELKLEKSTVTRFVDAMEQRGFVKRLRQGREVFIEPTVKAIKIGNQLNGKGNQLYQQMLGVLGKEELVDLVARMRETGQRLSTSADET